MLQRKRDKKILLSVIIPAFRAQRTIVKNIKSIERALKELGQMYEIIVVVDGALDNTYQSAYRIKSKKIKVLGYKDNQGKGFAVRLGMMHAKGDIVGFVDAGMDIHPQGFSMLLNHMDWYNADIIVGSKLHPVSKVNYPWQRKVLSWGYRLLTRLLFGFKIRDTQVGMKFLRKNVVSDILPLLLVKRFAFDIEMLAVAYSLGYKRIYEAPVEINFNGMSSVTSGSFWKVILSMLWDTLGVFYRLRIVRFYDKAIERIGKTQSSVSG